MRTIFAAAILALSACATVNEPGWTGSGAQPFDAAQSECQARTQTADGAAFEACMAEKGWTRPN